MELGNSLKEQLELMFSCNNLPDTDTFSKSDPAIFVSMQFRGQNQRIQVGSTETIVNNLNPVFRKPVLIDYFFESQQTLFIKCADQDGVSDEDSLGQATCVLSQVLMAPPSGLVIPLVNSYKKNSTVTIKYQRVGVSNQSAFFKIRCTKVKDIEFFSKSDPFLRIYRPAQHYEGASSADQVPEVGWVQVHETEFHKDNLNPIFNPFTLNLATLNRGNLNMLNKWEIWDNSKRGSAYHQYLGEAVVSFNQMVDSRRLIETLDKKRKFAGNIHVDDIRLMKKFGISDYIRLGLNLNLTVGVDFTGSNGIAKSSSSLHYMAAGHHSLNQYQRAIVEVGMIIMDYDKDRQVPAYGFGAKLPGTNNTNFCFPLNLNFGNPFVNSYEGVLQAYSEITPKLEFSGPTNFAPIINATAEAVQAGFALNKMTYSILLILTDGLISDFSDTAAAIVRCSRLPMSIIIIGVGNEDFSQMNVLDADVQPLKDFQGNQAVRDIVQFVPFRDYAANPTSLAEAVLRELPKQVDEFYQSIGIIPQ